MPRPVYSKEFANLDLSAPALVPFVLPDPNTYVIRDITWSISAAAGSGATLALLDGTTRVFVISVPPNVFLSDTHELRYVAPGAVGLLAVLNGPGATGTLHVSGYELTPA